VNSLLNPQRPPVFCPGCAHENVTRALDRALQHRNLEGNQVVIVSDIGCSGLFDTFFNTHALHGLHGRALTYATGLKMARPDLTVVVTMGDGGLGIGGAHLLSACRRNLDLTLLILNNFNYGMTGGQCSSTTPSEARVGSGFLNRLEPPLDVCRVAAAAGAPYVKRASAYDKAMSAAIGAAIAFEGFALVEIRGVCPGRYTKRNKLTPQIIAEEMAQLPPAEGPVPARPPNRVHRRRRCASKPAARRRKPAVARRSFWAARDSGSSPPASCSAWRGSPPDCTSPRRMITPLRCCGAIRSARWCFPPSRSAIRESISRG